MHLHFDGIGSGKKSIFTLPVKCHMFNVARHYVILPILPGVRCIAGATKNKTLIIKYNFCIFNS